MLNAAKSRKLASRLLAVAFTSSLIWGQFTSQIEGTVTDPSRAVIPGAAITLENLDTGVRASTRSNAAGYFRFPTLPASGFNVTAASASFKTATITGIHLEVGETRTVNFTMEVGGTTSAITVGAEASAVELSDARVSGVISNQELVELPMPGRDFLSLTILTPGVIGTQAPGNVFSGQVQPAINAAGTRQEQNGFSVDSSSVTSMVRHGNTNIQPNAESIQDVRVTVNNFSAEQGSDAGASINVLTKSGTNGFHGSAAFFHEDNILTSRTIFQNVVNPITGRTLPVFRRNEMTGSLGGPIIRNKMFIFGSFDVLRQANADGSLQTVETPQFISFVEQNFPSNKSAYLFKTFPTVFSPSSNFQTAGALLGTNCSTLSNPSSAIVSPIGAIPCNLPVTGSGVSSQLITQQPHQWNVRWDYNVRESDRLYFNLIRDVAATYTGSTARPVFAYISPFHNFLATIDETHLFSSSLINDFRASAVRTLGYVLCNKCEIPAITITGATGFGGGGPTPFAQNNFEERDNLTWIHGRHDMKAGVQVQRLDANWNPGPSYERPSFTFTNVWNFVLDTPFSEGNIGFNPTNGSVIAPAAAERQTTVQLFAQDTWKITPAFTLTYGLRWEYYGTVAQKTGGQNVQWQTGNDLRSRIADGKNISKPNVFDHAPLKNFAPRFSFAWDPFGKGKTSVRFGSGIFYDALVSQVWGGQHYTPPLFQITTASAQTAPLVPLYAFGASGNDPFGFPRPPALANAIGLDSHNGSLLAPANIVWDDESLKNPYTISYFLGIQHQLTSTLTVEVNYVGNQGRHLYGQWDLNRYDGDLLTGNTTAGAAVIKRLNPSFGSINYTQANLTSSYNSGNLVVRQRTTHGLFFQAAYTVGRVIDVADSFGGGLPIVDAWNLKPERGPAGYSVAQKLAFSFIYKIPAPRIAFMPLKAVAQGWQLSTVTILQSGGRFSVNCTTPFAAVRNAAGAIVGNTGCDYNADGTNNDRPNAPSFGSTIDMSHHSLLSGVFTASQFPAPGFGQNGNLGRNTYTNAGYADTDISMTRNFVTPWFTGDKRANFQFRADAFNAFNRVNLGGITSDMANVNFGKVTGIAGGARTFQLGARLSF